MWVVLFMLGLSVSSLSANAQSGGYSFSVFSPDFPSDENQYVPPEKRVYDFQKEHQDVIEFETNWLDWQFQLEQSQQLQGPGVSGGGNSVVCFDSTKIPAEIRDPKSSRFGQIGNDELLHHVTSITTYDLHFAMMPRGFDRVTPKLIEPLPNETGREYLERIARRFDAYMPAISALIRSGSNAFKDSNISFRANGLDRIQDENDVAYIDPSNCVVATMAAQYRMGDQIFLNIDDRIFSHPKHSRMSQYVLLLHEAIYSSVRTFTKQPDSHSTRLLVSAILREGPLNFDELEALYYDLGLPYWPKFSSPAAALWYTYNHKISSAMNDKLKEIIAGAEHKQLLEEFNSLVKKHLSGSLAEQYLKYQDPNPEFPYYAGNIDMKPIVPTCSETSNCHKDFAAFETKMLLFQDRTAVEVLKVFEQAVKKEILLPLRKIPGAKDELLTRLAFDLYSGLQEDNLLFIASHVSGGGRRFISLSLKYEGYFVQEALERARKISDTIP